MKNGVKSEALDSQSSVLEENEIIRLRKLKLSELQNNNNDSFRVVKYNVTHSTAQLKDNSKQLEGSSVSIAGRVMSKRGMGKASFCDLQDREGRIQIFIKNG